MTTIEFEKIVTKLATTNSIHLIDDFEEKLSENTWSKKEIMGHLIDSALNNIQRFTEIQFTEKPYRIRTYSQNEMVKANDYQNTNKQDIFDLWISLNKQILQIIKNQNSVTLKYQLILPNENKADLNFLINDYLGHFEHHLKQLYKK